MASENDKILFIQVKQGNKNAFDILFKKYYVRLCHFALSFTKSYDVAEETVQNIFVKIWCQRDSIDISTSFISYMFTAVRNQMLNELKKDSIRKNHETKYSGNLEPPSEDNPAINIGNFNIAVSQAVCKLPEKCREIFRLSKNDGLTYDEIADYLKISVKTVENQMGIAFRKLRESLQPLMTRFYG